MKDLFAIVSDFPVFYLVPLFVFGPVFVLVLYHFGLKGIFKTPPEVRERQQQLKAEEETLARKRSKKISAPRLNKKSVSRTPMQWAGQGVTYAIFALFISYFSNAPAYVAYPQNKAMVKLALAHPGKHIEPCRKRTREELQKLAVNMRAPMACSRERWPVVVDLTVDGTKIFHGIAEPVGLSKDGHSSFYQAFVLASGSHRVEVGIWDSGDKGRGDKDRGGDYDYFMEQEVSLSPAEILVIGFDNARDQIIME